MEDDVLNSLSCLARVGYRRLFCVVCVLFVCGFIIELWSVITMQKRTRMDPNASEMILRYTAGLSDVKDEFNVSMYGACRETGKNVTQLNLSMNMTEGDFLSEYHNYCCVMYKPKYNTNLPPCHCISHKLKGHMSVNHEEMDFPRIHSLIQNVHPGGHWRPRDCAARHHTAIIIPYRGRQGHLAIQLYHLHSMLQRQLLHYTIYVVHQNEPIVFNKASLMNVGYVEAKKRANYDCYIFHDVDIFSEDDRNFYTCATQAPRHVGAYLDLFNYTLLYPKLFGAATAFTSQQFEKVNGFSNIFYGWGGEDDDMQARILRFPLRIARFKGLTHDNDTGNPRNKDRYIYKKQTNFLKRLYQKEGLSKVVYHVNSVTSQPLYTHLMVDLPTPTERDLLGNNWSRWKRQHKAKYKEYGQLID